MPLTPGDDHDGELDLLLVNGPVSLWPQHAAGDPFAEPNHLYRGLGEGRFKRVGALTSKELVDVSRGLAFADCDNDGVVDAAYGDRDATVRLLRNVVPKSGQWLGLLPLDGAGAEVRLRARGRDLRWLYHTTDSFCVANDARVHFGLGDRADTEEVGVRWPDGRRERFGALAVARYHLLRRGTGE